MKKPVIVISGLPGKMAGEVAKEVALADDLELATAALGLEHSFFKVPVGNRQEFVPDIKIIEKGRHDYYLEMCSGEGAIVVDFTWPDAVNENAELYCKHKIPFVMGTTGGDRKKLEETVKNSDIPAVIAPNMCKEVVALQWAMEEYAAKNPGALKGYRLRVIESHQKGKKDTSGTAKAMVKYFNQLGIEFDVSQIEMIRDPKKQLKMGIPEAYLDGHGWHTYILVPSKKSMKTALVIAKPESFFPTGLAAFDGLEKDIGFPGLADNTRYHTDRFESVDRMLFFEFGYSADNSGRVIIRHNINGRRPYALGTLDAIRFVADKVEKGQKGCYSMIDILKGK